MIGLNTTPTVGTLPIVKPIETQTKGYLEKEIEKLSRFYKQ